jgi:hypothetical protein
MRAFLWFLNWIVTLRYWNLEPIKMMHKGNFARSPAFMDENGAMLMRPRPDAAVQHS